MSVMSDTALQAAPVTKARFPVSVMIIPFQSNSSALLGEALKRPLDIKLGLWDHVSNVVYAMN